jgi:hypothetical protein
MTDRKFSFVDIEGHRYSRNHEPEECPLCHFAIHPDEINWALSSSSEGRMRILEVVYQCPRNECRHFFIARYKRSDIDIPTEATALGFPGIREFIFYELAPSNPPSTSIPSEVEAISPSFLEIYTEALAAENYGLNQIAGVGYRKALEYIIKDYSISINKDKENEIKAIHLSTCITKFVDNPQVKLCAERAAWLGNDETHYVRKWISKDINNLKELITLTINWIHSDVLTKKYKSDMP